LDFGVRCFTYCWHPEKALKAAVSRVSDVRAGNYRRGPLPYPYSAGSLGLVDGAGYPGRSQVGVSRLRLRSDESPLVAIPRETFNFRLWGIT